MFRLDDSHEAKGIASTIWTLSELVALQFSEQNIFSYPWLGFKKMFVCVPRANGRLQCFLC